MEVVLNNEELFVLSLIGFLVVVVVVVEVVVVLVVAAFVVGAFVVGSLFLQGTLRAKSQESAPLLK